MHKSIIQYKIRWAKQQTPKKPTNAMHKDPKANKDEPKS
jgi:hypothetical protein